MAPEPVLRAALSVLHHAAVATRNWTLSDPAPRRQIYDLWEAIHEIPAVIADWRDDTECMAELRLYLREYKERWNAPDIEAIFEQALSGHGDHGLGTETPE